VDELNFLNPVKQGEVRRPARLGQPRVQDLAGSWRERDEREHAARATARHTTALPDLRRDRWTMENPNGRTGKTRDRRGEETLPATPRAARGPSPASPPRRLTGRRCGNLNKKTGGAGIGMPGPHRYPSAHTARRAWGRSPDFHSDNANAARGRDGTCWIQRRPNAEPSVRGALAAAASPPWRALRAARYASPAPSWG